MKNLLSKSKILLFLSFCIILLLFFDILKNNQEEDIYIKILLLLSFVCISLCFFFFSRTFKKAIFQATKIEKILNSQKNILIVTNGSLLIEANRAFLKFFSFNSLEDFKKEYKCICDHFIEEDGYLKAMMEDLTWAKYLYLNPDKNLAKIKRNGEIHTFKVFVQKIDEEKNLEDNEIVVTFEDISKELKANKEISEQKVKLQNANNSKAQFLANISHELRTPLNSIVGFSKLLFDTKLEKEQYELLKKIDNSSTILINTIDSILEIAKIDMKKIVLAKNVFTFDELIKDIEDINIRFAINSTNKFFLNKDPKLTQKIISDKARILQVLTNFISNAYKFTDQGEIKLDIKLLETLENDKLKVLFSVKDTGIGIEKESQAKIFDEFFQDTTKENEYSGNGLGLAISTNIITAFDSNICLESELNKGSKFSFVLTFETVKEEQKVKYSYPIFENVNVLIVDDNEMNCELFKRVLEKSKISVTIAKNGKEAVDIFEANKNKFDLILMDLQMPVLDGFEATRGISQIDTKVPIIALTASTLIEDKQKANEVLMNDFLSKPVDTKVLYEILQKYITKLQNVDIEYKNTNSRIINDILNKEVLLSKLSSEKQVDKILKIFLNELNSDFSTIISSLTNSEPTARFMVHSLKGLSGNISANNLFKICVKIYEKFKRDIKIDFGDIKCLKEEIENIKSELSYLNSIEDKIEVTDFCADMREGILQHVLEQLKSSTLLSNCELKNLYEELNRRENGSFILDDLKHYIDDFEYEKAKELLEKLTKN